MTRDPVYFGVFFGVLFLSTLVAPRPVCAHPGHIAVSAERYIKLDVGARHARLVVSLTLTETEGRSLLAAADVDDDGSVSEAEAAAYMEEWGTGLRTELPVEVDGVPVEPDWRDAYLDPVGAVRPVVITAEIVGHFELAGGEQTVHIEDRMVGREAFVRTEVSFQVRDGAELIASGLVEAPREPTPSLYYAPGHGGGDSVPLVARLRTPPPEPEPAPSYAVFVVIGVSVAALLGYLFLRRKRQ